MDALKAELALKRKNLEGVPAPDGRPAKYMRRGDLERYLSRVVRHPVARYAEVISFFLTCENEAVSIPSRFSATNH